MKDIIPIVIFAVFLICVKSECDDDSTCAGTIVKDILKGTSVVENVDIKLEVPKFQQIKNVKVEDLNQILYHLTSWFENRLNETNFIFKHISNKTKIFVKSFDFNVDFDKGKAKIDVDLTEETEGKKRKVIQNVTQELFVSGNAETDYTIITPAPILTTTTPIPKTTTFIPVTASQTPSTTTRRNTTTPDILTTTSDILTTITNIQTTTPGILTTPTPLLITETPILTTTKGNSNIRNKTEDKINKKIDRILKKLTGEKENEIFKIEEFDTTYYDANEDNATDYPIIDYVEIYKDTTNEDNVYIPTERSTSVSEMVITTLYEISSNTTEQSVQENATAQYYENPDPVCHNDVFCKQFTKTVFPWVVTIFVTRTTTQSQFSYFCDGALITDRVILTAARCMHVGNSTWEPQNVLVFLGKTNLQTFAENEKVQKIKYIVFHPKYKVDGEGNAVNDLALLVMEDSVEFKENIQTACIHAETSMHVTATTAWSNTGALVPIFFKSNRSEICYDKSGDIVCATYGNDVALCPSYGGSFASNQANRWCLQGIMHGNPAERGPCFNKNVHYTLLANYLTWIDETVGLYKNDIL